MTEVELPATLARHVVRTPPVAQLRHRCTGRIITVRVHRHVCELQWGQLDVDEKALHTCDETSCVRPGHLYPGTQAANLAQMARRGRSAGRYHRGLADLRGAGGRARAIRAALQRGYNPDALAAAMLAGNPRRDQLALF